ncbi:MAG: transposase [Gallionella sp.]|nr:transposase [Gallionella sp.]
MRGNRRPTERSRSISADSTTLSACIHHSDTCPQRVCAQNAARRSTPVYEVRCVGTTSRVGGTLDPDEILKLRRERFTTALAAFKRWVDDLLRGVPPQSVLGKALAYTTKQ